MSKGKKRESRGFSYYFNNHTIRGRANVSKATIATLLVYTVYKKFVYTPSVLALYNVLRLFYKKSDVAAHNLPPNTNQTMAGAEELKGMGKYFNGSTIAGRANVAKATYASIGLLIMYFSLKPKKK